jgi:hypothetical protein
MRTFAPLVTLSVLLVLFGSTESRLGVSRLDEHTLPDQQEDASTDKGEPQPQARDLQQGAPRSDSNPNTLGEDDNAVIRVIVGFKNESGRGEANRVAGRKWMREMKNIKVATMLIPRVSLESLQRNPNIE